MLILALRLLVDGISLCHPGRKLIWLQAEHRSGIRMHCCLNRLLKQPYQVCHVSDALWILNSRLRKPTWQRQLAAVTTWEGSSDAPFQGSLAQPLGVQSCSHGCGVVLHLPAVTCAAASCLNHEPACTTLTCWTWLVYTANLRTAVTRGA